MKIHPYLAGVAVVAVLAGSGVGEPAAPVGVPVQQAAAGASADLELVAASTDVTAAAKVKYVFPVKASNVSWHKTHSGYPATDIFVACGKPFRATTSGVVLEVSRVDKYKKGKPAGPNNGGKFVSILGDDGVRYYGSHLSSVASGIKKGVRVKAGQQVGKTGKTGNASNVCHVHYGISPACKKTGDWKVRRGVVWAGRLSDVVAQGRAEEPGQGGRGLEEEEQLQGLMVYGYRALVPGARYRRAIAFARRPR